MIKLSKALSVSIIAFKFASVACADDAKAPLVLCALYFSTSIPANFNTLTVYLASVALEIGSCGPIYDSNNCELVLLNAFVLLK